MTNTPSEPEINIFTFHSDMLRHEKTLEELRLLAHIFSYMIWNREITLEAMRSKNHAMREILNKEYGLYE